MESLKIINSKNEFFRFYSPQALKFYDIDEVVDDAAATTTQVFATTRCFAQFYGSTSFSLRTVTTIELNSLTFFNLLHNDERGIKLFFKEKMASFLIESLVDVEKKVIDCASFIKKPEQDMHFYLKRISSAPGRPEIVAIYGNMDFHYAKDYCGTEVLSAWNDYKNILKTQPSRILGEKSIFLSALNSYFK